MHLRTLVFEAAVKQPYSAIRTVCVSPGACLVALPRLAAGNSTNNRNNDTMAIELETMQDGFQALQTGYGILGAVDYARFPASSVPQLSLSGDKPFTLFVTLCFRNVQGGLLFEQQDLFSIGIMDGQLYVMGLDWCRIKFSTAKNYRYIFIWSTTTPSSNAFKIKRRLPFSFTGKEIRRIA